MCLLDNVFGTGRLGELLSIQRLTKQTAKCWINWNPLFLFCHTLLEARLMTGFLSSRSLLTINQCPDRILYLAKKSVPWPAAFKNEKIQILPRSHGRRVSIHFLLLPQRKTYEPKSNFVWKEKAFIENWKRSMVLNYFHG